MKNLSHFMLTVTNVATSIEFYKKLGFSVEDQSEDWAELQIDSVELALKKVMGEETVSHSGLGFSTDDCQQTTQELKDLGIDIYKDCITKDDGSIITKVLDPDGNIVWFSQK
jgi:predicted enzyme related to lactoylglutathione lyase